MVFAVLAVLPAQAMAAQMIARNAKWVSMKVKTVEGQRVRW